jgi:hypothetical protein
MVHGAAPFLLLPSTSTPSSTAAARTPTTSSSIQSNKEAALTDGFFKWARDAHINNCLSDASDAAAFLKFGQRSNRQIKHRFKEQRQTVEFFVPLHLTLFPELDLRRLPSSTTKTPYQMPCTKRAFVDCSRFVGAAKKAKNTVVKYYTIKPLKTKKPAQSASTKLDKPQSNILYELFAKMKTGTLQVGRKLSKLLVVECLKLWRPN